SGIRVSRAPPICARLLRSNGPSPTVSTIAADRALFRAHKRRLVFWISKTKARERGASVIRLDRLLTVLGGYGARSIGARLRSEEMIRSIAVHDPTRSEPDQGDIFLAIGMEDACAS